MSIVDNPECPSHSRRRATGEARMDAGQGSPEMPPLEPHGPELMKGFTRRKIRTSGAEIEVAVAGSGPPLLLIHGNPLTLVSWHKVAPTLARSFTVVAIDIRGYGDSSKPDGGEDHAA